MSFSNPASTYSTEYRVTTDQPGVWRGVYSYSIVTWCFGGFFCLSFFAVDDKNHHIDRRSSETSTLRAKSQFQTNYQQLALHWASHLFVPLLPPVHIALCAEHHNTTQTGLAVNDLSATLAGFCATNKIVPEEPVATVMVLWGSTYTQLHFLAKWQLQNADVNQVLNILLPRSSLSNI